MKRILISLSVIAFVAAAGFGATRAYFSSTATVTGNTFTAGTLGLNIGDATHSWTSEGWTADPAQFANLYPGQSGDIYLAMQQTGTVSSKGTISLVGTSGSTNDLAQNLTFTVGFNGSTGGLADPTSYTYVATPFNATLAALYAAGSQTYELGNITSSDKIAHVKIHWVVNPALTTQGQSVTFNTVLGLTQNIVPTVATSNTTGFEPSTFSIANINGQGGWKKTGSYDATVVNSPVIAGAQSLRISNAVTSGSFGDQTFAPLLSSGAGETGIASNKHFEAQFDIASTQTAVQPGLSLSVSPDNGSGARMSYLRFEDQSDGIHVFFDDVTDATHGTAATFNESDIATISRSAHTIKFVMDFVNGSANDVVKIYIDGVLTKTGTSWEDYYRNDPEQASGGYVLSPVDTLIFRAGGTAVSANNGKGFLFDNVSLSSGSI